MKREEKNQKTRGRIMEGAMSEFAVKGYSAGSVNAICMAQGVSKGIIYHYFDTKADLYLACVDECFTALTEVLRKSMDSCRGDLEQKLEMYFTARMDFFKKNPRYQRIFCEAALSPPAALADRIKVKKNNFDMLNMQILARLLEPVRLRSGITEIEVIETFRQFQDFVNAEYRISELSEKEFEIHEKRCRKAVNILLYGVIDEGDKYERN